MEIICTFVGERSGIDGEISCHRDYGQPSADSSGEPCVCQGEGNYSRIFTVLDVVKGSKGTLVTYKLGWIHNSLSDVIGDVECKTIVRAGKSHIINLDFVSEINISQQTLALSDCDRFNVVLSDGLSREVLKALKSALGNDNND